MLELDENKRPASTLLVRQELQALASPQIGQGSTPGTTVQSYPLFGDHIRWSPDGQFFAWIIEKKAVEVWEAASGKLFTRYQGHTNEIDTLAWSPDGRLLASTDSSYTALVWEAISGKQLLRLRHYCGSLANRLSTIFPDLRCVAWSPDGRLLASGGTDMTVHVWDVASGRPLTHYRGHAVPLTNSQETIRDIAWSPDGEYIASTKVEVAPPSGKKSKLCIWQAPK